MIHLWHALRSVGPRLASVMLIAMLMNACAPSANPGTGGADKPPVQADAPDRTLRIMLRNEADNLAAKVLGSSSPERTRRAFDADLAIIDGSGSPRPYLAARLPQLNTDTWRVFDDGRMETAYSLRPNLAWHDGAPLTAADFVFAWRVYTSPSLGIFSSKPQDLIDEISVPDATTLLIRWNAPYPEAGALVYGLLPPLPEHILQPLFASVDQPGGRDAFVNAPFWTTEYVGAGPFRLVRWDGGYELEGAAFDGHALGRPKISRVILRIVGDENAALTQLLSGSADYAECFALRFEHAQVLAQDWIPSGKGQTATCTGATNNSAIQMRPELAKGSPMLDIRVRRAMAHSIDRHAILDGVYNGQGSITETFIPPEAPYFAAVDRAITHYAYDPGRTAQLMTEAGLVKDGSGFYMTQGGERFSPEYWITAGAESERAAAINADSWRRSGIDIQPSVLSLETVRDNELRARFSGMTQVGLSATEDAAGTLASSEIGTPTNRFRGNNRGGWSNAAYDRLWRDFNTTLDRDTRDQNMVNLARIVSDELPILTYHPNFRFKAFSASLRGPEGGAPATLTQWNISDWDWS